MRTVLFLIAGFLLLAACALLARLFSATHPEAARSATIAFAALWLTIAGFNMWIGVTKAGYSAAEELPIFALIFGVPVATAVLIQWRFH